MEKEITVTIKTKKAPSEEAMERQQRLEDKYDDLMAGRCTLQSYNELLLNETRGLIYHYAKNTGAIRRFGIDEAMQMGYDLLFRSSCPWKGYTDSGNERSAKAQYNPHFGAPASYFGPALKALYYNSAYESQGKSKHYVNNAGRLQAAAKKAGYEDWQELSDIQLMELSGISLKTIAEARKNENRQLEGSASLEAYDGADYSEEISPEKHLLKQEQYGELYKAISTLPKQKKWLIRTIVFDHDGDSESQAVHDAVELLNKDPETREGLHIMKNEHFTEPQIKRELDAAIKLLRENTRLNNYFGVKAEVTISGFISQAELDDIEGYIAGLSDGE